MANNITQIKVGSTIYDINDSRIILLEDNSTATAGTWLAKTSQISAYADGQLFIYKTTKAGASTTTLNITGSAGTALGAKTVYRSGSTKVTTQYPLGTYLLLVYNSSLNSGCFMVLNDYDANTNATHSGIGICSTAAATAAKVVTFPKFTLATDQTILVRVNTTNSATSGVTLNVNSTGAKSIYIGGSAWSTSNQLSAGDYLATYDGTYWKLTRIYLTDNNTTYSLVGANGTTGLVKNGSSVTSTSGLTACPIISGIPYYKDTNTQDGNDNQKVKTGSVTFGANDVVEFVAGTNVSISGDATNKKITISATDNNTHNSHAIISGTKSDGSTQIKGSASSGDITLGDSGVTAGTYKRVTVNAKGIVVGGDNTDADTHYTNYLQIKGNGTEAIKFTQNADKSLNLKPGTNVSISAASGEITISATDTDTKVTQTQVSSSTYNKNYPLLMAANDVATTSSQTTTTYKNYAKLYANPYNGQLTASSIIASNKVQVYDSEYDSGVTLGVGLNGYDEEGTLSVKNVDSELTITGSGKFIFIDSDGNDYTAELPSDNGTLALIEDIPTSMAWSSITGKPSSFTPSSHTHTTSLTTSTGTSSITLAHGGRYQLSTGGTNVIFTMPSVVSNLIANYNIATIAGNYFSITSTAAIKTVTLSLPRGYIARIIGVKYVASTSIANVNTSGLSQDYLGFIPWDVLTNSTSAIPLAGRSGLTSNIQLMSVTDSYSFTNAGTAIISPINRNIQFNFSFQNTASATTYAKAWLVYEIVGAVSANSYVA